MRRPSARVRRGPQAGFALVELLAAVALLAVLAGVVVVVVGTMTARAKDRRCESERRQLETAVESYRAQTGYFPSNQGILVSQYLDAPITGWDYEPPQFDLRSGTPTFTAAPDCQR